MKLHTLEHIYGTICEYLSIDKEEAKKPNRKNCLVYARQLYGYFAKKYTTKSYAEISALVYRDHSTIVYSVKAIKDLLEVDRSVRFDVEKLDEIFEKKDVQIEIETVNLLEICKLNSLHKTFLN